MLNIILGMSCQFLKLNSAVNKLSAISHIILGALTLVLSVRSEDEDQLNRNSVFIFRRPGRVGELEDCELENQG